MSSGPKNQLVADRIAAAKEKAYKDRIEKHRLADTPKTLGEWRTVPDSREHARRGHVWELLAWYHHEVIRPELGLWPWLRRLWWRLRGEKTKLKSPWEQLALRAEIEARMEAETVARELAARELED